MASKLIKRPAAFRSLPKTDAANVPENIENWISKGRWSMIEDFCRPTGLGKGYRFVTAEELSEIKCVQEKLLGKECTIIYSRRVHAKDSFCPLYFTEWYLRIVVVCEGKKHEYVNDNRLRKFLHSI